MPSTYNGIGTRYYGRKNLQTRPAVCNHCHRQGQLKSYDTRLWFVVLYIPVIPLERKHIADFCPSCSWHYVTPLHKWETARQQSVTSALQQFQQDQTPENAIHVHQQLVGFSQYNEADEFRKIIGPKFQDNASVQTYLGDALTALGRQQEALPYYRKALALSPGMPQAAVGVAREAIRQGSLDEARRLLAFLEQPGAGQKYSLQPIELLANAFQTAGRHSEALDLYGFLLKELPSVGLHESFRKRVKTSEVALKRTPSILPEKKFSVRDIFSRTAGGPGARKVNWVVVGAILLIAAVIALGVNEYTRRHRTLYIVNGFDKPATVTIDGYGETVVERMDPVVLPEGKYHAHITGPVDQTVDFQITTGYFDRWGGTPAWLLNVGGAALLEERHGHYRADNPPPEDIDFIFGQTFTMFPQMDYPFQELPHSTELDSSQSEKTLTNLRISRNKPIDTVAYLAENGRTEEAIRLAQWDLNLHPDDLQMLYVYSGMAAQEPAHARFINFLRDGLSRRPVAVEWHRIYQENMETTPDGAASLRAAYDGMLQKEPANSALLYLRGRIAKDRQEGLDFFNRALKEDPKNAYAHFALGYDAMARGEWQEALPLLSHAVEYGGDVPSFRESLQDDRFATKDFAAAENEARSHLQQNPFDGNAELDLVLALVAESRAAEAQQAVTEYENRLAKDGDSADPSLRIAFLYATNKPAEIEKIPSNEKDGKGTLCIALMEEGRSADAEKLIPLAGPDDDDPFFDIAMGTAWLLEGDSAHASPWIDHAAKLLQDSSDNDLIQTGKILASSTPPSLDEMKTLVIPPQSKSLLAACLALRYPGQAAAFGEMAAHYNILLVPPHYLIAQVTAKTHPAP